MNFILFLNKYLSVFHFFLKAISSLSRFVSPFCKRHVFVKILHNLDDIIYLTINWSFVNELIFLSLLFQTVRQAVPDGEDISYTFVNDEDKFDEASSKGVAFSCSSVNPIDQLAPLKREAAFKSRVKLFSCQFCRRWKFFKVKRSAVQRLTL